MEPVDEYGKENRAASSAAAPSARAGGSFMKATASSKSRFGAPAPTVPTGLRPNLNGSTYISSARPATARGDYAGAPRRDAIRPSPTRAGRRRGGRSQLFRRLNIVKREA